MSSPEHRPLNFPLLCVLAVGVGGIAGFGAVLFRWMIGLCHNAVFLGEFSIHYNANTHTAASPWGWGIIIVPVLGAICVAFLVKTFAPEAKGHGVPEVMDAIWYNRGVIRPVVAVVKSVASAISIGTGGSVGREGPIVQIGAAFASSLGQWVPMPAFQRSWLIAAGAGGGIAATFNTPIGGMLFAIELMLPSVRARSLLIVALGSAVASWIGTWFLGVDPAFNIPEIAIPAHHPLNPYVLPVLIISGIVFGLMAALFNRSIYWTEDLFDSIPGNYYTRHCLGMLIVGIMMYVMIRWSGHYYIQGVGYATVVDVLNGELKVVGFLVLLAFLKLAATCLTLGSGASGGVFSPSLFIGATLGGSIGLTANALIPGFQASPTLFAVAGMAAMVGGTTGALPMAVVMVFEMTQDFNAVLPVMIVSGICYAVRHRLVPPSVYTLKLLRRGHYVPSAMVADMADACPASSVMSDRFRLVAVSDQAATFRPGPELLVYHEGSRLTGTSGDGPDSGENDPQAGPLGEPVTVNESTSLRDVLIRLNEASARVALVIPEGRPMEPDQITGYVSLEMLARAIGSTANLQQ